METLIINEIYSSIQGEGSRSGLPCTFVRFQGCGLRCTWCDTPYALEFRKGGEELPEDEVMERISGIGNPFVELTGGEPLEQRQSFSLMRRLCDERFNVAVETGGHVGFRDVDPRVCIIMDLKCPGSGMEKKNLWTNLEYLKASDEIKFVISDTKDYEWSRQVVRERALDRIVNTILFSPVYGQMDPRELASLILQDGLQVRLQLQLHKYIWEPDQRGV